MNLDRIVDLSMPMYNGVAAGGPGVNFFPQSTHDESKRLLGYTTASNFFLMHEHCGTHVDSFYHFKADGQSIDEIDIRRFILPARVVDLTTKKGWEKITDEDLQRACTEQKVEVIRGGALLIHCRKDREWYSEHRKAFDMPFLVESAARWVHEQGLSMIGQDAVGFENANIDIKRPVHNYLLHRNVILLEGVCNLNDLVGKRFTLFAVPIKFRRGTGAQCRAYAVLEP